jgi:hypothetical protein
MPRSASGCAKRMNCSVSPRPCSAVTSSVCPTARRRPSADRCTASLVPDEFGDLQPPLILAPAFVELSVGQQRKREIPVCLREIRHVHQR